MDVPSQGGQNHLGDFCHASIAQSRARVGGRTDLGLDKPEIGI
jgi:hypothetical protein